MSLKDRITEDMKAAMRAHEAARVQLQIALNREFGPERITILHLRRRRGAPEAFHPFSR